jgi:succinate-semialdehyde dehydrogenase/glutarate-semialdehyde dehydrogenase
MDEVDTDKAIAAAAAAFPAFAATPARVRARMLLELDKLFREAKDDIAQLITMETGKPLVEAKGEVEYAGEPALLVLSLNVQHHTPGPWPARRNGFKAK